MADVLIVCVREDETQAKALADMFEAAGFSVGGAPANDGALRSSGAGVIVWSQASIRSRPFLDAAQRVVNAGKAVIASLIEPPPPASVNDAPAFDLTGWNGDADDTMLDPIFFAVDRMVNTARVDAGQNSATTAYEPRGRSADTSYARPRATPSPNREPPPALPSSFQMRSSNGRSGYGDTGPNDALGSEAEHWRSIRHSKDPTAFLDYLARFGPEGAFSELAELRLKQLEGGGGAALHSAARSAQQPARTYDPPPRRPEPRRPEPRMEHARSYDPPPRRPEPRRYDPPPQSRRSNYDREFRSPVDAPPPRAGGGFLRVLVLIMLLGGALAGGIYFGLGDTMQSMLGGGNRQQVASADTPPPLGEPASIGADAPAASSLSDVVEPSASQPASSASRQRQAPQPAYAAVRSPPPAPARPQQAAHNTGDGPPPAPITSWSGNTQNHNVQAVASNNSGGPVSLLPGAQQPASNPTVIVPIANSQPPPATQAASAVVGSVLWASRPNAQRLTALYPSNALRQGLGGSATLDCVVRSDLGVSCAVASETPAGVGFGRAALAASSSYRAQPTLSDGSSAVGARTRVSIAFRSQGN